MNKELILLIDCSSVKTQWGLADKSGVIVKQILDRESNADSLISLIRKRFIADSLNFQEIGTVMVSNGPGSFTGLRIASAIAKGICLSTGAKLVEINSLDVLANKFDGEGKVVSVINSNMKTGELYFCSYEKNGRSLKKTGEYGMIFQDELVNLAGNIIAENDLLINKDLEKRTVRTDDNNIDSLYQFGLKKIGMNKFSDISTSEPFYIKEFEPVLKKKQTL